jgi:hypothetical protein
VRRGDHDQQAQLASWTARGEVGGLWLVDDSPIQLVLREGWLLPRTPSEVLPKDARIATLAWRPGPDGRTALVVAGANLLLGGRRLVPDRPEVLAEGDTLVVDHHDVGEPAGAVVGGLLVGLPEASERPWRWLVPAADNVVEAPRPGAGRVWLHLGLASLVAGALPLAAGALAFEPGDPWRGTLLLGAIAATLGAGIGISLSRVLAHAGPTLEWNRQGVRVSHGVPFPRVQRYAVDDLDGFAVRLGGIRPGGWSLDVRLRTRGGDVPLERGAQLRLAGEPSLPAVAALEARRLDWIDVARRVARTLGRSPDAFVTVQTDSDWPPERARGAIAAGKISLS